MTLIPTAAKDRLPKGFSYPLGAQAVSIALEGIPVLNDARFWLSWRDEYWTSEWRQKIQALGQVTLLEVHDCYVSYGRDVRVYAVPSEYSVSARERLTAEFPKVRRALLAAGDSLGSSRVTVTLNLAEAANRPLQVTPVLRSRSNHRPGDRRP
jgi:hypothetical protein